MNQPKQACCTFGRSTLNAYGVRLTIFEIVLGVIFAFAAKSKLHGENAPDLFATSIKAFKVPMSDVMVRLSTGVIPWVELVAAVLLILGIWRRAAAAILGMLLIVFIVLIVQALARQLDVSCGCFGKISPFCPEKIGACNLVQNGIMLAIAAAVVFTPREKMCRLEA